MNKKAVEMSVNTIIVIVIVLLILLVMAFLLTGGFQNFSRSTDCETKEGYDCKTSCADGEIPASWSCPKERPVCCGPGLFNNN